MGNVTNLGKDSNGKWVPMGATTDNNGNPAGSGVFEILQPAGFDITWAGAGTTNAPATTDYWAGAAGINNDGATGANVYHVVEIAGVLTWIDTGATAINLYGG